MSNTTFNELKDLISENNYLKQELLNTLDEKEKLVLLCEELLLEKEKIEKRYTNLKNSKLGRVTTWMWERRKKARNAK